MVSNGNVDQLRFLLQSLLAETSEIQGTSVVSAQGLPIVTVMNSPELNDTNEGMVSAMSAALIAVAKRAADELKRGELTRILLEGEIGTLILTNAGENAILTAMIAPDGSLGLIFRLMNAASKRVAKILES